MAIRELLAALVSWWRHRNVDHFELRWRPPGGRGWRQVEDDDRKFEPSNLDEPIPFEHIYTHAKTRGYYQGEYRLVPINDQGQMGTSVWQEYFWEGPDLRAERQREQAKREKRRERARRLKEIEDKINERYSND